MDNHAITPFTLCFSKAALAAGTTTTLSNTGTINYAIRGKAYSKAAMTNAATPTLDWCTGKAFTPIPVGSKSVFIVGLDSTGALRAIQGSITADGSAPIFGGFAPAGSAPNSNDFCPIGYVVVTVGATGAAWTFGSSNFAGPPTGVTFSFQDLAGWPDRPQLS